MFYGLNKGAAKKIRTNLTSFSAVLLLAVTSVSGSLPLFLNSKVAAAGTVTIQGNTSAGENQPGWMFARDTNTDTPFEFNTNEASIGNGSLYVPPIGSTAGDKFIGEYFMPGTLMTDINSFSIDYLTASNTSDYQHFYLSIYANFGSSSSTKFYDCRYNVIASVGSTSTFNTLTFDPTQSYTVATRGGADPSPFACPSSPAGMNVLSANSTIRMISVNVGDSTASDTGVSGYYDKAVLNLDSDGVTTFDFEPISTVPTDPGNGGQSGGSGSGAGGNNLLAPSVANPVSTTRILGITSGTDSISSAVSENQNQQENKDVKSENAAISNASTENNSSKKSWWWLLLIVLLPIAYGLYRRYQQNSANNN